MSRIPYPPQPPKKPKRKQKQKQKQNMKNKTKNRVKRCGLFGGWGRCVYSLADSGPLVELTQKLLFTLNLIWCDTEKSHLSSTLTMKQEPLTILAGHRICCRRIRPHPQKKKNNNKKQSGVFGLTLNSIGWWGSSSGDLGKWRVPDHCHYS